MGTENSKSYDIEVEILAEQIKELIFNDDENEGDQPEDGEEEKVETTKKEESSIIIPWQTSNVQNQELKVFNLSPGLLNYIMLFAYKGEKLKFFLQHYKVSHVWRAEMILLTRRYNHYLTLEHSHFFNKNEISLLFLYCSKKRPVSHLDTSARNIISHYNSITRYGFLLEKVDFEFDDSEFGNKFTAQILLCLTQDVNQIILSTPEMKDKEEEIPTSRLKHLSVTMDQLMAQTWFPEFFDQLENLKISIVKPNVVVQTFDFLMDCKNLRNFEFYSYSFTLMTDFHLYPLEFCQNLESLTLTANNFVSSKYEEKERVITWPKSLTFLHFNATSRNIVSTNFLVKDFQIPSLKFFHSDNSIAPMCKLPEAFENLERFSTKDENISVLQCFKMFTKLKKVIVKRHMFSKHYLAILKSKGLQVECVSKNDFKNKLQSLIITKVTKNVNI